VFNAFYFITTIASFVILYSISFLNIFFLFFDKLQWYPYDYKIGKHIYRKTIIFEGNDDWKFEIPMIFFEETRDEIIDNITDSCEMTHIRAEKNYET